jgi:hypothetical protein
MPGLHEPDPGFFLKGARHRECNMPREAKCACGCGRTFVPFRSYHKYYSSECRLRAAARKQKQLRKIKCPCGCGRWFVPYKNVQKYFSPECRHESREKRIKARLQRYYQEHRVEKMAYSRGYYHSHKPTIKRMKQQWWRRRTTIDYSGNRVSLPGLERVRIKWWK